MAGEATNEERLVRQIEQRSQQWARDFWRVIPHGTAEDSVEWLKGIAGKGPDAEAKGIAQILVKALTGPITEAITVPVDSQHGYPVYPSDIWRKAVREAKSYVNTRRKPISIRGLDYDLYTEARAQAIRENKNIGQWLNEAIKEKLQKK
jgi:hypothetical protein